MYIHFSQGSYILAGDIGHTERYRRENVKKFAISSRIQVYIGQAVTL